MKCSSDLYYDDRVVYILGCLFFCITFLDLSVLNLLPFLELSQHNYDVWAFHCPVEFNLHIFLLKIFHTDCHYHRSIWGFLFVVVLTRFWWTSCYLIFCVFYISALRILCLLGLLSLLLVCNDFLSKQLSPRESEVMCGVKSLHRVEYVSSWALLGNLPVASLAGLGGFEHSTYIHEKTHCLQVLQ